MKKKANSSARQSKNELIETYLQEKYDFRFNVIKSKPEYRIKDYNHLFLPVTKFILNSFKCRIDTEPSISTSVENIRTISKVIFHRKGIPSNSIMETSSSFCGTLTLSPHSFTQ